MRKVAFGYNPDFAPFCFADDGQPGGLLIERTNQVLKSAGITADFTPLPLATLADALAAGRVEALVGMAVLDQRRTDLAFSRPLVLSGGAWFSAASTNWPSDTELRQARAAPWRVVTPANGPLVRLVRQRYPHFQVSSCEDYPAALRSVVAGEADCAALNWHVGRMLCERLHPGIFRLPTAPFFPVALAIAVPVTDPLRLLPQLDPHFCERWGRRVH